MDTREPYGRRPALATRAYAMEHTTDLRTAGPEHLSLDPSSPARVGRRRRRRLARSGSSAVQLLGRMRMPGRLPRATTRTSEATTCRHASRPLIDPFETQVRPPASGSRSRGSMGSCVSTRPARSPPSRARSSPTTPSPDGGRRLPRPPSGAVRRGPADHDLRALFARSGRGDEAAGARGHLPGRLGHLGEGLDPRRIPGPDLAELPPQPGSR